MMDAARLAQLAFEVGFDATIGGDIYVAVEMEETPINGVLTRFAALILEEVALHLEDIDPLCAEEVRAMKEG